MKIKEVMQKPVFVSPTATKKQLFAVAKRHPDTELFIVVDRQHRFLGDIHENDLFLMLLPNERFSDIGVNLAFDLEKKFFATKAKELMRRHDITCSPDDDLLSVALRLAQEEVNEMPVVDAKDRVVGWINEGLLARHLRC
ncbi:MAG: CBS domain-containing protein [Nanoarchaeota archaeon]